ncbi:MAG TPA: AMP-binding protein [Thermodesulfobacteriota bacterium]|nr:AMP-binding protein [Deltaproteobacteria bacterium]HNU72930.1 AMP-binding protein [Thermodesulfobacteriota bacterium]
MAKPTRLTKDMIEAYVTQGYWQPGTIADTLSRHSRRFPDKTAVVDSGTRITWSRLEAITDTVAVRLLSSYADRDQVIAAQLPNSINSIVFLLACQKAGIISCFVPLTFRHTEAAEVLKQLKPTTLITAGHYEGFDYHSMARAARRTIPQLKHLMVAGDAAAAGIPRFEDLYASPAPLTEIEQHLPQFTFGLFEMSSVMLGTSTTTGLPTFVEHTGASSLAAGKGLNQRTHLTRTDTSVNLSPLSGAPGMQNWWAAFLLGAATCFPNPGIPDQALQIIQQENIRYLALEPDQLTRILEETNLSAYDLSSLRVIRIDAASLDPAVILEAEGRIGSTVLIAAGTEETYSFAQSDLDDPDKKRLSTVGRGFPGDELKIVSSSGAVLPPGKAGRLLVRGATTSSGYFQDLETTLAAWGTLGNEGWYAPGYTAMLDSSGYLTILK